MRVSINRATCEGTGFCVRVCPDVFAFDESGKAVVTSHDVAEADREAVVEAEAMCPTTAITLVSDEPAGPGPGAP